MFRTSLLTAIDMSGTVLVINQVAADRTLPWLVGRHAADEITETYLSHIL